MNINGKKFSLFHFKGLPIAILALGLMVVFVFVSYYATQQAQIYNSSARERGKKAEKRAGQNVGKKAAKKVVVTDSDTASLDLLISDTDSLLKTDSDPTTADLSELE